MKFAINTQSVAAADLQAVVAKAKEWGYEGLDIAVGAAGAASAVAAPILAEPDTAAATINNAGLAVCCLSSDISFTQDKPTDAKAVETIRGLILAASRLRCPAVRVLAAQVKPKQSRGSIASMWADRLRPSANFAADHGVSLLIENSLSFPVARELWSLLETMAHPAVAISWNLLNALSGGEQPAVSVPTLGSRIALARATDLRLNEGAATPCQLGEGDVPVRKLVTRLRGIGYRGWISVGWDGQIRQPQTTFDAMAADAVAKLKDWTMSQSSDEDSDLLREYRKKHPKPVKPAPAARPA
jgi:sugar phosphate isomerase/epimerase